MHEANYPPILFLGDPPTLRFIVPCNLANFMCLYKFVLFTTHFYFYVSLTLLYVSVQLTTFGFISAVIVICFHCIKRSTWKNSLKSDPRPLSRNGRICFRFLIRVSRLFIKTPSEKLWFDWQRQLLAEPLAIERNTLRRQFRIMITLIHFLIPFLLI